MRADDDSLHILVIHRGVLRPNPFRSRAQSPIEGMAHRLSLFSGDDEMC